MKKFYEIVKIQFSLILQSQNFTKSKKIKGLVTLLFIVVVLMYTSGTYSYGLYQMLPTDYKYLLIHAMGTVSFVVIFIFCITSAQGQLFEFKDFDRLMSWPISRTVVFAAKMTSFVCMMLLYQLFLIVPTLVVYGMNQSVGLSFYLLGLLGSLFLPLIPIVLSCIIALIVRKIAGNGRFKKLFINLITVSLFLLILIGSFTYNSSVGSTLPTVFLDQLIGTIRTYLYPVYLFAEAMIHNSLLTMVLFMAISTLLFTLFLAVFSKLFVRINSQVQTGYKIKNFKLRRMKSNSPIKTLILKELNKVFSNFMYFFNLGIGQVFLVIGGIYLVLNKTVVTQFVQMFVENDSAFLDSLFSFVCIAMIFFASMTATACVSVSLEGKHIWITKTIPVKIETILLSKALANAIIIWIPTLIGFSLISFSFGFHWFQYLLGFALVILIGFWVGLFGVSINLNFPKLDFDREILVIKQSMSSMIAVVGGIIISAIAAYIGLTFIIDRGGVIYTMGLLLVLSMGDLFLWHYLKTKGVEKFERIM